MAGRLPLRFRRVLTESASDRVFARARSAIAVRHVCCVATVKLDYRSPLRLDRRAQLQSMSCSDGRNRVPRDAHERACVMDKQKLPTIHRRRETDNSEPERSSLA